MSENDTGDKITMTPEVEKIVKKQLDLLKSFSSVSIRKDELLDSMKTDMIERQSKLEIEKHIFLYYAKRLRDNPEEHKQYNSDEIPEGLWQPMTRLLTAIRVEELKQVKVTRRKGKYDIKELREAYFGKKILEDLPQLGARWMLSSDEYKKIQLQCKQLQLELPTVIEPTTTEKFFDDE